MNKILAALMVLDNEEDQYTVCVKKANLAAGRLPLRRNGKSQK